MDYSKTNAWIVPIKGHAFDLEDLPIYLEGSAVYIQKQEGDYFLVLPTNITGLTYEDVGRLAREHLDLINGASSILLGSFRPLEIGDGPYFGIDANGNRIHTVVTLGTAEVRCQTGHLTALVNGVAQPDLRTGQATRLLQVAATSTAASDALVILGRSMPSWSELYLVYELVESNVGGRMYLECWIGRTEGKLFTRTANSYTALGRAGRHGKDRGRPPAIPMSHPTAIKLMRSLVWAWLTWIVRSLENAG